MTPTATPVQFEQSPKRPIGALTLGLILTGLQLFLLLFTIPKFEAMFKEMDITELPVPTMYLFALMRFAIPTAGLMGVLMVVLYRGRQAVALTLLCVGQFAFFGVEVIALFMPLIGDMEKIGK